MYNEAVCKDPWALKNVPDHLQARTMCEGAIEGFPALLWPVPDHFKTQQMCERAVEKYPWSLKYVPDWFVTQGQMKLMRDVNEYCNDNRMIEWYEGYQKRKAQKASIKEELLSIAWHPSRYCDWCMSEDEKKK